MHKGFKLAVVAVLLFALSGCLPSEEKKADSSRESEPMVSRLNMALGQVEGSNYAAGTAICVALKKGGSELPCKLMASEGSRQNLSAIASGQVDLALVRGDNAYQAWHGKKPFNVRSAKLRVLFSLHHEMVTLLTKKDASILSFAQIVGKPINIGEKEADNGRLIESILNSCQISIGDHFLRKESHSLSTLLDKEEAQGGFDLLSHPDEKMKTLASNQPLQFLPVAGQCIEQLVDELPYLDSVSIPAGLYSGLDNKVPTVGSRIWLVASSDLPDGAVYDVVKAVFEGIEQFRRSDPAFYHLSPRQMLSSFAIPYHVGAVQYYIEKGWYTERR